MIPRRKRSLIVKFSLLCSIVYLISIFKNIETPSKEEDSMIGESIEVNQAEIKDNDKNKIKDDNIVLEAPPANDYKNNEEGIQKDKEINNKMDIAEVKVNDEKDRVKVKEEKDKADEAQNFAILPPKVLMVLVKWGNHTKLTEKRRITRQKPK